VTGVNLQLIEDDVQFYFFWFSHETDKSNYRQLLIIRDCRGHWETNKTVYTWC